MSGVLTGLIGEIGLGEMSERLRRPSPLPLSRGERGKVGMLPPPSPLEGEGRGEGFLLPGRSTYYYHPRGIETRRDDGGDRF